VKWLTSPTSAGHAELCSGRCTTIRHGVILRNENAHTTYKTAKFNTGK